jgi:hypothetical protein
MFSGVSTSGSASLLIQVGSGTIASSAYIGGGSRSLGTSISGTSFITGFGFNSTTASDLFSGNIIICNLTSNTWVASGVIAGSSTENADWTAGRITLSGALDRVRITTSNGTDTFDAGTVNVFYE